MQELKMDHPSFGFIGRLCAMWRQGNIDTPPTLRLSHIAALLAFLAIALPPAAGGSAAAAAEPLSEPLARQAYRVAEVWLEQAEVPSATSISVEATGVLALHVTLRHDGQRLGQGTAALDNPHQDDDQPVDLMPLLNTAVRTALREAVTHFDSPSHMARRADRFTLDLQVAHGLEPIEVDALHQVPASHVPGLHGLAMRRGDAWAFSFPASRIATNTSLRGQLNRMLVTLDYPLDRLAMIGADDGPPLYRFQAIHLVRATREGDLLTLHRGNPLLPAQPLAYRDLAALTDQLLAHLLNRERSGGRFAGGYQPTADQFSPSTASPVNAATAAYALARAAQLRRLDDSQREDAASAARRALAHLTTGGDRGDNRPSVTADLASAAMALIALLETPGADELTSRRDRLANAILSRHQADGSFTNAPRDGDVSLASHALATAALVRLYDRSREEDVLEKAKLSLNALWPLIDDNPARATDALPWLVIAELDLDRLDRATGNANQLAETAASIWRTQIQPWHDHADRTADIVGGFLVADTLLPEPNWQSARILAGQARLLQEPQYLQDDQVPAWLNGVALAARFLKQLTMQPESAFYASNPAEAIGGARTSLSNNGQPLAATALSLLATVELEHALQRLAEEP